ncbi:MULTISPECIES: FAD-dependent thymidylate synthase [Pseudomonas]|nr:MULTISPECIES: FAD-dependent thymidylate synthase [Pseudomonas]MCC0328941.1 FAD-dependent thymidylate synthase [Pseudomonas aeruginosa]MCC0480488.1 FAD-dependent thymidylate synthase [Pseudomonas aeruginosa]MCL8047300.1 FAD-dependent thymidylate synthase [Pseudomonas aeruginosa]MCS8476448.1 FAD-dependent thymidylate synthase [Pseudomonas aeruginosa]MCS8721882.1 FAD-dependent thymidylate synthase [Pseudomonas aeruginosa]
MDRNSNTPKGYQMKVSSPYVRCIAKTIIDLEEIQGFLDSEGEVWKKTSGSSGHDDLIEFSGRICYMSFGKRQSPRSNKEYLRNLIDSGHGSVLEHVCWTFVAVGVSRGFTHQLVRHRAGFSYSQLSQQYYDESDANFVAPPSLKIGTSLYKKWMDAMHSSLKLYRELIASAKELSISDSLSNKERMRELRTTARSILPNAIETKIVFTANARAIRNFLIARGAIEGDWEMRDVSCQILNLVKADAPSLFQDFEIGFLEDGSKSVIKKF